MSKIFDSHCHLQSSEYDTDRGEVIARAESADIGIICAGTNLETSKQAIELAQKYNNIWATVGLHPNDVDSSVLTNQPSLSDLCKRPKVIAVGEIGLDYYRMDGSEGEEPRTNREEFQKKQKDRFVEQLKLAKDANLPVVLHCRDGKSGSAGLAYPDMISILRNWKSEIENSDHGWRAGVVHSCTATLDEAKQLLDLGFYLGFNGIITFARQYDEVVRYAPLDRILVETDAPFLTPEPYRGQRNEPSFVTRVVDKIGQIKGVSKDEVSAQTTQNCLKLFRLDQTH